MHCHGRTGLAENICSDDDIAQYRQKAAGQKDEGGWVSILMMSNIVADIVFCVESFRNNAL
jgi:hypothetical protein